MAEKIEVTPVMVEAMAKKLCGVAGAYFDLEDKDDRRWLKYHLPDIYRAGRAVEPPRKSEQRRVMGVEMRAATLHWMSEEEFREAYKVWRTEYMRRWRARRRG